MLDLEDTCLRHFVGRDLFSRVGPLRNAAGLRERLTAFIAGGASGEVFDLAMPEAGGERRLRVRFGRVCADIVIVRISEAGRSAGDGVL